MGSFVALALLSSSARTASPRVPLLPPAPHIVCVTPLELHARAVLRGATWLYGGTRVAVRPEFTRGPMATLALRY